MYSQQPDFLMVIAGLGLVVLTKEATGLLISTNKSPRSLPPCPSSLLSDSQEWTERLYWTRWSWQQSVARTETSPPNEPRSLFTWIIGQQAILNPRPERGIHHQNTASALAIPPALATDNQHPSGGDNRKQTPSSGTGAYP